MKKSNQLKLFNQGVEVGRYEAMRQLIQSKVIIFDKALGYGQAEKWSVDMQDAYAIKALNQKLKVHYEERIP